MDIKIVRKVSLILLFCFFLCSFSVVNNSSKFRVRDQLSTSDPELPDKVYAFIAPNDTLTFEDLPLQ